MYAVRLIKVGLLSHRVAEAVTRLLNLSPDAAETLANSAPVLLAQGIDEESAYRFQRELQMLGAVVEIERSTGPAVVEPPPIEPATPAVLESAGDAEAFDRDAYHLYLHAFGPTPEQVVAALNPHLSEIQTAAAVQYRLRVNIRRVRPTLLSLPKAEAEQVAAQLRAVGAEVSVHHADADNQPAFDHNRFGVTLREIGPQEDAVVGVLVHDIGVDRDEAAALVAGIPSVILEKSSVDRAIELSKQLNDLGAYAEVTGAESTVFRDTSTDHIEIDDGNYRVVLHQTGYLVTQVAEIVANLHPDKTPGEVTRMIEEDPTLLLADVSLQTAELAQLLLQDFGATAIIQETGPDLEPGASLHPQNPDFRRGPYRLIITAIDTRRRIFLIRELRRLLPGRYLQDIVPLTEDLPAVVIDEVSRETAIEVRDRLVEHGAEVAIQNSADPLDFSPPATSRETKANERPQDHYRVLLQHPGPRKIQVIILLRDESPGLSLADAKRLTEALPSIVGRNLSQQEAQELAQRLEASGAKAEFVAEE